MQTPSADNEMDRRWYPDRDAAEWVRATRHAVFESVVLCFARALAAGLERDMRPEELYASDQTYRELHACVGAYAGGLYALGQSEAGVVGLILAAALDAAGSNEFHPAIAAAIAQWCREAQPTVVDLSPPNAGS